MVEREEAKFGLTPEGEIQPNIPIENAIITALNYARDDPGTYGHPFAERQMVFEVDEESESMDFYSIRLAFQPASRFQGSPGIQQFFIDKTGTIRLHKIIKLPCPDTPMSNLFGSQISFAARIIRGFLSRKER